MFFAALTFLSAVSISLTAAYFSVIGLATMFPGSKEAIIIMGGVLEVGKLIASVWLHHNWNDSFKFLKRYLLFSVVILSLITSMGIFGFLSRSHVEHHASMQREEAIVLKIDEKITREQALISRKQSQIESITNNSSHQNNNTQDIVEKFEVRIGELKDEKLASIKIQEDLELKLRNRISELDSELNNAKPSGIFSDNKKYELVQQQQSTERQSISSSLSDITNKIQSISEDFDNKINETRGKIDNLFLAGSEQSPQKTDSFQQEIDESYDRIEKLEQEKFEYGSKLRALEVEVGPILYIANLLNEWGGFSVDTSQAIRIVIITLIFVFDPLAILLLIASTMTFAKYKKEELPPDVIEIRNKLLEELEDYLADGGIADHFIDRAKK